MKTVIEMAREAGFYVDENARQNQPNCISHTYHMIDKQLERFAALVAEKEREACAKVCEEMRTYVGRNNAVTQSSAQECAAAIRARGQQ